MKVVDTWALVDSSANISCINWDFVKKYNLPTTKLTVPIWAQNADHFYNKNRDIQYTCDLFLNIQGLVQKITLYVMTCGKENVILGLPWLKKANPFVNWTIQTLTFDESIDKLQELYHCHITDTAWHSSYYQPTPQLPKHVHIDMVKEDHLGSYLKQGTESQYICYALDNCAIHWIIRCGSCFLPNDFPVIACLTTMTELAAAAEKAKPKPSLSPKYTPYASVFLKEAMDHVSSSHPYNHEINLDEAFKPKISKVYTHSPEEQKTIKNFLDENLKTGKIHSLNSPQASSFFFIKKKKNGLCPCQDYHYINEHTIHDAYPFPSSLTSLTNFKEWKSSPNSMFAGDIITFTLRMDTIGKLPLSLIKDSSNQLWCSLALPTPLPPCNDSWTTPSTIWSWKAGSSSTWTTSSSIPLMQ